MRKYLALAAGVALFAGSALAQEMSDYVGEWSASRGEQTLTYALHADGKADVIKRGVKRAELTWGVGGDGVGFVQTPQGNFSLKLQSPTELMISPPAETGQPGAVFTKEGG